MVPKFNGFKRIIVSYFNPMVMSSWLSSKFGLIKFQKGWAGGLVLMCVRVEDDHRRAKWLPKVGRLHIMNYENCYHLNVSVYDYILRESSGDDLAIPNLGTPQLLGPLAPLAYDQSRHLTSLMLSKQPRLCPPHPQPLHMHSLPSFD